MLYTTQPNVSKVIKSLESKLGFPVFSRENRGITLTNKGRRAYEYAVKILEQEKHLAEIYQLDDREEVNMSSNPSSWIAETFTSFYQQFGKKQVRYQLIEANLNHILERVSSGEDDIGFIFFMESQREHLDYKFIIALEGNDVASNLKWVMSSNSLAVMTRPTCETWFMEGQLRPDYHYVEVKEDFSDFEDKLKYYIAHPEKAEEIIAHAHEYVSQFRDNKREELLQLMVMQRYFETSGQM